MHINNEVYKGYRLTAKLQRHAGAGGDDSGFTAHVLVMPVDASYKDATVHDVPRFASGGSVFTPNQAVEAAILHGHEIVDGFREAQLAEKILSA
ncbi:hypothetical protein [Bordetella flabilis]|uniref:Uncharacterized protein n=1 Tax=Bordetella flabilis TaxID=463014 RepID=A0A193GAU9_9BORD|nr:hypothetical protein [Bordetella flabilis]ANN76748.1 hypothetical protein BAU07_06160 [Bordetella flabilis]